MNVILYNNSSEPTRVDKTDYLTKSINLNGTLRSPTSVVNPSITFELTGIENVVDTNEIDVVDTNLYDVVLQYIIGSNYAYIPEFRRYYFITNITSINQNLWQIDMNCDVLMTYKNEVKDLTAMVTRNQFEYNEKISDNRYPLETNCVTEESEILMSELGYKTFTPDEVHEYNILVTTFTNELPSTSAFTRLVPSSVLSDVTSTNIPSTFQFRSWIINREGFQNLQRYIIANSSDATGIVSIMLFPFEIDTYETETEAIWILNHRVDTVRGYKYKGSSELFRIAKFRLTGQYGNYLDYSPYSQYELFLPYKGWINLDPVVCLNKDLQITYAISIEDGSCMVFVTDETSNKLVYGGTCNLGISTPVNTTNKQELEDARLKATSNMIVGMIGSNILSLVGVFTGNGLLGMSGIIGAAKSAGNYISTLSTLHDTAQCNIVSGEIGEYSPQNVRLRKSYPIKTLQNDSDYLATSGKPLNEYRELKNVHGYTELTNFHLENFSTATNVEIKALDTLLRSGVIL